MALPRGSSFIKPALYLNKITTPAELNNQT